jgi:hypothetical protein
MKLHRLVPNFYVHVSVSDFYVPTIGPRQTDRGNIKSTHRYMNMEIGRHNIMYNSVLEIMRPCSFISGKT